MPQFQSESRRTTIQMEINAYSYANQTHFPYNSCAPKLTLKPRQTATRKWPILHPCPLIVEIGWRTQWLPTLEHRRLRVCYPGYNRHAFMEISFRCHQREKIARAKYTGMPFECHACGCIIFASYFVLLFASS